MKNIVFRDDSFAFETLRLLSETAYGMADIGEVLTTAEKITEGDNNSWCKEWTVTAKRLHTTADDYLKNGHPVSARKTYLRAYNYYRSAEFYLHGNPNDPRINELSEASFACFEKVMELNDPVIKAVKIPYEGTTLPGHYYKCQKALSPSPVLILMTGFDGTKEELYGMAMAALEHGMNCLVFEGPGQGEALRRQNLYFRYDYESVVTPVVDFVLSLDGIDPDKIVLMGVSLGGYLAPRAAAYEHRLAACVANGGVYSFSDTLKNLLPDSHFLDMASTAPDKLNQSFDQMLKTNPTLKWGFEHGMFVFGANTPAQFILKIKDFTMEGVAEKIQCPTLIVDTEEDKLMPGQARPLYDALTCEKSFMLFSSEEGAGEHGQCGAKLLANERILSWIDERLLTSASDR
ncbi:alpha/beta hydrolase family protein [Propionispora hippei]|uniref:Alpha/beta hydrolase family protein n=1 Tax=Propionispora hippei DSM 15287 TaxID=1123003 RepID=A0A1M6FRI1_9FIRM|nr:alpha/beta fold hydrolase [Propionispora hippei]SHJ00328.1 Alpha/beta hydrolase family protein [Propionispora hippei DSM 15287]